MLNTITGKTRVHLLIGSPIAQVLAPGWLSGMMQKAGYDGVLIPMHVEKDRLATSLPVLKLMPNVDSILITLPHKFEASAYCDALSGRATILGAINAMRREPDGSWYGDNFDGAGLTAGLLKADKTIAGKHVFMVGAGGAGSSIAVSMLQEGARHITIRDINEDAQKHLLRKLEQYYPGRASAGATIPCDCDIVVNATSSGMKAGDPLPVIISDLSANMIAVDVITDPIPTPFLEKAASIGCFTRDGTHMLDGQIQLLYEFMLGGARHPTF